MKEIEEVDATVKAFIEAETVGFDTVVELGAGRFEKLELTEAKTKIGVEKFGPLIQRFRPEERGMTAVCADMLDYKYSGNGAVCMIIDSLEHVDKSAGEKLLRSVQEDFSKVLVVTPVGFVEQEHDAWKMDNPFQRHLCGWEAYELEELGFEVEEKNDLLYGVWQR